MIGDRDEAIDALHVALEGLLKALVVLDGLGTVQVPADALDAALGNDESVREARAEFARVHAVVADIIQDEMVVFEIEAAAHNLATVAVDVGFRIGLAARTRP